jgi:hypothetical protein
MCVAYELPKVKRTGNATRRLAAALQWRPEGLIPRKSLT